MDDFTQTLIHYKIAIVLIAFISFFVFERIKPIVQINTRGSRLLNNFGMWAFNSVFSLLIILPLAKLASENSINWRSTSFPVWADVAVNLLLLDFLIYWWHRANHEINFLWRFHEIHHLDQVLDVTTSIRFHFGEILISSGFRVIVIILFDISFSSIVIFEILVLLASGFHHSNIEIPRNWDVYISLFIVTPSIHGSHHHAKQKDTDSNYSTILSCWDWVFRSNNYRKRAAKFPIGVEHEADTVFVRLLIRPFLKK